MFFCISGALTNRKSLQIGLRRLQFPANAGHFAEKTRYFARHIVHALFVFIHILASFVLDLFFLAKVRPRLGPFV